MTLVLSKSANCTPFKSTKLFRNIFCFLSTQEYKTCTNNSFVVGFLQVGLAIKCYVCNDPRDLNCSEKNLYLKECGGHLQTCVAIKTTGPGKNI